MEDFKEAYGLYFHKVYRFLRSLSGSEQMADELTQEVFYRAFLHIGKYKETGNMFTWLCTIGKNIWLNECRKQKHLVGLKETVDIRDSSREPEKIFLEAEQRSILREAVLELPDDYRDVVILHIYGEIPLKEIAAQKGKSESWGKVTFYRAKRILAQKLEGLT